MEIVVVVGAGRSGTTWLQLMLGASPAIATGQESQVFQKYLGPLYEQWQRELRYPETDKVRKHGITSYLSEGEFVDQLRQFATTVFNKVHSAKPGARYFLEKSPSNSFYTELLFRCLPDARYVHIIRDGRDVTASMLAAGLGWGKSWAPASAADGAREWKAAVSNCRGLRELTPNYTEVRYEDLLVNGVDEMMRLFEFLEIATERKDVEEIYDRFSFDKLKKGNYKRDVLLSTGDAKASGTSELPEPEGFFRKGVAGGWNDTLNKNDLAEIYWVAGDTLSELGYTQTQVIPDAEPGTISRRRMKSRLRTSIKRLAKRLLG